VRGLIVIVTSSTFSSVALAYISYNLAIRTEESYRPVASADNPDAESDALMTIPSVTIADKIGEDRFSFQGDPAISEHLYWSSGGRQMASRSLGSLENSRRRRRAEIRTS